MAEVPTGVGFASAHPAASAASATKAFNPLHLLSGFVGGIAQSFTNYQFNQKLQQQQNDFNRQQIAEQNNYNSPNAVKNRLIAAGVPEKAALQAIAGSPSLGQQTSVATAAPPIGELPGTDFIHGMQSTFANSLVDAQTVNQEIQNKDQRTINQLQIKELQEQIYNLGLSNQGKEKDLYYQPFIRNLEVANLDLYHLMGLYELSQYQLALNENPYIDFVDYKLYSEAGPDLTDVVQQPSVAVYNSNRDTDDGKDAFNQKRAKHLMDNRANQLKLMAKSLENELSTAGIDSSRLSYISSGIEKEAANYIKRLDTESIRLLAQGKVEELRKHIAEISLSKKDWLFKMIDVISAFGPLMSTLMSATGSLDNVSSAVNRSRVARPSVQFNPTTTSFSW